MKILFLVECTMLCIINLNHFVLHKVKAMSSEITYPLGSILGNDRPINGPGPKRYNVIPFEEPIQPQELSELNSESYSAPNQIQRKNKKKTKKKLKTKRKQISDELHKDKFKTLKRKSRRKDNKTKKKKNTKKLLNTSTFVDKSYDFESTERIRDKEGSRKRKPVDIVVHIKMQD